MPRLKPEGIHNKETLPPSSGLHLSVLVRPQVIVVRSPAGSFFPKPRLKEVLHEKVRFWDEDSTLCFVPPDAVFCPEALCFVPLDAVFCLADSVFCPPIRKEYKERVY